MTPIRSIGVLLDGNRRWAKSQGLPSFEGHKEGLENIKRLSGELPRLKEKYGLEYVTLFGFSTENWNRSPEEVGYLMKLFEIAFGDVASYVERTTGDKATSTRVQVIGQKERFSASLQKLIHDVEERTRGNGGTLVSFALSYGGRAEIIEAVNAAVRAGKPVDEATFSSLLWTAGIPDPDIIIRTGGEHRLSNFMTWGSVYSELFFTPTYWPAFTIEELERIFEEYYERERRHGR